MSWYSRRRSYRAPKRKTTQSGIKPRSTRGVFGQTWWAKSWVEGLEFYENASRLQRGRSYARSGQVLELSISLSTIRAAVLGSEPEPYSVKVEIAPIADEDLAALVEKLALHARYPALLLAGNMPEQMQDVFEEAGVDFFPDFSYQAQCQCDCYDYEDICKHACAALYLVAEELDRDPFLLLELNGLDRAGLLAALGMQDASDPDDDLSPVAAFPELERVDHTIPVVDQLTSFWQGAPAPDEVEHGPALAVGQDEAALGRLGEFPMWRGLERPQVALQDTYTAAAARASALLLGLTGSNVAGSTPEEPAPGK